MPTDVLGWGAATAKAPLKPIKFERRDLNPDDVSIKIAYCGVCHSDLHTVRGEWEGVSFPMVPGHEIVGHVTAIGKDVHKFKVGDAVGVGNFVDSCLHCEQCNKGNEQYCLYGPTETFNSKMPDGTITFGGYSDHIVVREHFVLRLPTNLNLAATAPLLCAGITTSTALRHWGVKQGTKVGVVGLGGLGHMAVKLAHALGADVTVFTTTPSKTDDAKRLGAHHVILSTDNKEMEEAANTLDILLDVRSDGHDLSPFLNTLKVDGTQVLIGAPGNPHKPLAPSDLFLKRRSIAGTSAGGIAETQEMLDFCGKHNITADIELIKMDYVNEAFERMLNSDVRFRFVIDMTSLH